MSAIVTSGGNIVYYDSEIVTFDLATAEHPANGGILVPTERLAGVWGSDVTPSISR